MTLLTGKRVPENRVGFTLVELVFVILLIAILAGFSVPLFRSTFSELKLKDTAFNLAKIVNYAQEMAILERVSYKLNFNLAEGKFWLSRCAAFGLPACRRFGGKYGKTFRLPRGLHFSAGEGISFYPDGRSDTAEIKIVDRDWEGRILRVKGFGSRVEILDVNS